MDDQQERYFFAIMTTHPDGTTTTEQWLVQQPVVEYLRERLPPPHATSLGELARIQSAMESSGVVIMPGQQATD